MYAIRSYYVDEIPRAVPDATFERDVGALIAEARMRRPDIGLVDLVFTAPERRAGILASYNFV